MNGTITADSIVKRFAVVIEKASGISVEFKRYARLADAEIDAKALRGFGIEARALGADQARALQSAR